MIPDKAIVQAIGSLGGKASPPMIRRLMKLATPRYSEADAIVLALEELRRRGLVGVSWINGCAFYTA